MESNYDELLSTMFKAYSSSGLGGDMKFVDSFFSFLRRKTTLLRSGDALNRIQDIVLRQVSEAKKDMKKAASTATTTTTTPIPASTPTPAPVTQIEKLDTQKPTVATVEKPKDSEDIKREKEQSVLRKLEEKAVKDAEKKKMLALLLLVMVVRPTVIHGYKL